MFKKASRPNNPPPRNEARGLHCAAFFTLLMLPACPIHGESIPSSPPAGFATPPYLQNMSRTTMVVMAETTDDAPLVLRYRPVDGGSGAPDSEVAMESTPGGGGTFFVRAVLENLVPGTEYRYMIAPPDGPPPAPPATFRTAPDKPEDFVFGVFGDVQTDNQGAWEADPREPAVSMLKDLAARRPAFGLGLGDFASNGDNYASVRDSHLNRTARHLGSKVPFFIAWGNHDGKNPSDPLRLSADMPSRWRTDTLSPHTPGFGSFSFEYGGVFFVCLEYFTTVDDACARTHNDVTNGWLDAALSSSEARAARFRVVAVHAPPFCERWVDGCAFLREHLVPRLEKYGVALCLSGHMHGFERGELNGVTYIIAGGGSYLDHNEKLVKDWPHMVLGGDVNVPGFYRRQSAPGVLGPPEPIQGGLFSHYLLVHVSANEMKIETLGFNADGSPIGILDQISLRNSP